MPHHNWTKNQRCDESKLEPCEEVVAEPRGSFSDPAVKAHLDRNIEGLSAEPVLLIPTSCSSCDGQTRLCHHSGTADIPRELCSSLSPFSLSYSVKSIWIDLIRLLSLLSVMLVSDLLSPLSLRGLFGCSSALLPTSVGIFQDEVKSSCSPVTFVSGLNKDPRIS